MASKLLPKIKLQLGDLIEIVAPGDTDIHHKIFLIEYIDLDKIRLEEPDGNEVILTLTNGNLDNESIESIKLKSRAKEDGYARQNNLIIGVWISIYFEGELPTIITGKITNLENDKIEVTTYPENEVIFIDFAYQGLPEDLSIDKIQIRRAPEMSVEEEELRKIAEGEKLPVQAPATAEQGPVTAAQGPGPATNIRDELRTFIFKADQIRFGEELESVTRFVDVPEEEQRYDIDKQLDDLLDNMLSTIPNAQRTDLVKNNIHKMIQRFSQLRDIFSIFDDKGYALMPKAPGATYKPLIEKLEKLEQRLYWILPIVKSRKKMYENESSNEIEENEFINLLAAYEDTLVISFAENLNEIQAIVKKYETNDTGSELNKYEFLQKELNPFLTPFTSPENKDDVITSIKTNTTINALVSDINSTRKRFSHQNYITGTTGLDITKVRGENPSIKRKFLTSNDTLDIKSLLSLPEPTLRFSKINLPSTHILEKANLNTHFLNYWQLLNKNTKVTQITIKDLTKPYNYENSDFFLKNVTNFTLDEEKKTEISSDDKYNKFLETIIPKTKFLFNHIKSYLDDGKLSIYAILSYLEPFMIYQSDLTFTQYTEMNDYIKEKIIEYRKKFASKSREYEKRKVNKNVFIPSILKLLDENQNLRLKVLEVYGFTDIIMQMSNSELLKHMNDIDSGKFFNNAIALISTNLMIANGAEDFTDINNYLKMPADAAAAAAAPGKGKSKKSVKFKTSETGQDKEPSSNACNKVIAKRYIELDELNEDNGKEIFFDKKYDPTQYTISKPDKNMPLSEQIQYYIGKLKMKDEVQARREAESMVKGRRTVENGEYAILETTDEESATIQYYVRENEQWILDETIDSETFADNLKMFCNLNEKCIAVKDQCKDDKSGISELKKSNLELLFKEFDTSLDVNKEIITNKIESELNSANERIQQLRNLKTSMLYKYDAQKLAIGNTAEIKEHITSPYDGLLSAIMVQPDMAKRYVDIVKFVQAFTRTALNTSTFEMDENDDENDNDEEKDKNKNTTESSYWLYCVKSNKKMLPTFIHTLATVFLNKGDYELALDEICTKQGTISEDGDKWIDKHSGYTIKMISLNEDEEYNEAGFKIVTRAVIENDIGDIIMQDKARLDEPAAQKPNRKYSTPDANTVYNVIETMSTNLGIDMEPRKDFIVSNVLKQMTNTSVIPTKAVYEKQLALLAAKGKIIDTFDNAFNSTLLFMTLSYFLIAIQISTPPIKTKTTFPGCKKSFNGFPADGTDNMKGVTYIACVANKIKNKASQPWMSISNRNAAVIVKQMEANITKFILPTEEFKNGLKEFKQYQELNPEPEITISKEHDVTNWQHFLPPLRPVKMSTIQDVGEVFKTRLVDSIRKGQSAQQDFISEVHSKIILFSYSIIDLIENTVQGEQAVLKSKSGDPFVENACCTANESNTLDYFITKQPEIAVLNNKVVKLSNIYDDAVNMTRASILYDPSVKPPKILKLDDRFSEETIYRAFIVYCRFNSLLPLNENLKAICPTKPDHFDMNDTIEESIRKLKNNARNYNEQSLLQLLDVINKENKQPMATLEKQLTNSDKLSLILSKMDTDNVRPSIFRAAFMEILDQFELNELSEDTAQMRKFKNILAKLNEDMQKQINDFVTRFNINTSQKNLKKFKSSMSTITDFKETGNNTVLNSKEETGYKMINFMKNTMRCITSEYPNIIINGVKYSEQVTIPKHWKISQIHEKDIKKIIIDHYKDLNTLYGDPQIKLIMEKLSTLSQDITDLARQTIMYAPVEMKTKNPSKAAVTELKDAAAAAAAAAAVESQKNMKYTVFDLDLTSLLFKYYFLSVLTDIISMQDDTDILQLPLLSLKTDEDLFMKQAEEMDILAGNKTELADKIVNIVITFTNLIHNDKSVIDYNYKGLKELLLRSKEKEKDDITDYLKNMSDEEREVENIFKSNKLERWSKGEQKGLHTYDVKTYDQEREEMEKMALREVRLNKKSAVTDMNRDIYNLEMIAEDEAAAEMDNEDNRITYMGEDAEPEDYDMDGDEDYY